MFSRTDVEYGIGNHKRQGGCRCVSTLSAWRRSRRLIAGSLARAPDRGAPSHQARVKPTPAFRGWLVAVELIVPLVLAGFYVAYERIGTNANAGVVEITPNLAGGFLALGMTDRQPGFLVLSAMDRKEVEVQADRVSNRLAGTHTVASVRTPRGHWWTRLREPQVVLVRADGALDAFPVDWSFADFQRIREGTDCSRPDEGTRRRHCGMPFADLHELLLRWPRGRVPTALSRFLESAVTSRVSAARFSGGASP